MWLVGDGDLLLDRATRDGDSTAGSTPSRPGAGKDRRSGDARDCRASTRPRAVRSSCRSSPAARRELERYAGRRADPDRRPDGARVLGAARHLRPHDRTTTPRLSARCGGDPPAAVRAALDAATDASLDVARRRCMLKAEAFALAYDAFRRAVALNSRNAAALSGLVGCRAGRSRAEPGRRAAVARGEIAVREPANAPVRIELSRSWPSRGDFDGAARRRHRGARCVDAGRSPGRRAAGVDRSPMPAIADRLSPLAESLVAQIPGPADPRYYRATALFLRGRTEDALATARHVARCHPDHARAQNLLGAACATLGRRDCARAAFDASIRANPRDASTYVNLGHFRLQFANPQAAASYFAEALVARSESSKARTKRSRASARRFSIESTMMFRSPNFRRRRTSRSRRFCDRIAVCSRHFDRAE